MLESSFSFCYSSFGSSFLKVFFDGSWIFQFHFPKRFRIFSRYYKRNNSHKLCNVPYVDNSYKWSGGGFLSNVDDLMKFGESMRKSFHSDKGMDFLF